MDGDAVIVTHQDHAAAASPVIKIEASFLAARLGSGRAVLPGEEDDEASN